MTNQAFSRELGTYAEKNGADVVVMGHSHIPKIVSYGQGKIYINAGESCVYSLLDCAYFLEPDVYSSPLGLTDEIPERRTMQVLSLETHQAAELGTKPYITVSYINKNGVSQCSYV